MIHLYISIIETVYQIYTLEIKKKNKTVLYKIYVTEYEQRYQSRY